MQITQDGWTLRGRPDGTRLRVLLLTSDDPQHDYVRHLLAQRLDLVATVVEPGSAQKARLRSRRRYRDAYYRWYQGQRQRLTGRARYRSQYFGGLVQDLPPATSAVHRVDSINSAYTRALIRDLAPDLTVVCGTGVLGRTLIAGTPGVMVNIHGGWLPDYKGNHGVYFAYRNRDWDRIGATLHLVTPTLDAGPVLRTVPVPLFRDDTDEHLYCRAVHHAAVQLTRIALRWERGGRITAEPQPDRGVTYRHRDRKALPELGLWLRRLQGRHRVPGPGRGRRAVIAPRNELAELGASAGLGDYPALVSSFSRLIGQGL